MDRDLDSDRSSDDDDDRSRARPTVMERGRVHQTDFRGDNFPDDGWTATFAAPTIDLNFNEDGTGPINIPESLTEESSCVDFLFLFVEDDFWQNLTNKTNLRAQQVPCPQRHTPGNHWPEIPEATASNHVCTVCLEKPQYNRAHPGVAYKDKPHKKVKTNVRCSMCKKYLCVRHGSTCWEDYHSKAQYWR